MVEEGPGSNKQPALDVHVGDTDGSSHGRGHDLEKEKEKYKNLTRMMT